MATTPRTAAQAARTLSHHANPLPAARGRRISKRTRSSSPLESLTALYHLTPTFVPTASPSTLSSHLSTQLAPSNALTSRPKPTSLRDLVTAHMLLDNERVRLHASGSVATSLLGLDLHLPSNTVNGYKAYLSDEQAFDHRESVYSAFKKGGEPFLAKRVRRVVDALHGTSAGGRAGVKTMKEVGEKAKQWQVGLGEAREQERQREREQEREAEEFAKAFEEQETVRS